MTPDIDNMETKIIFTLGSSGCCSTLLKPTSVLNYRKFLSVMVGRDEETKIGLMKELAELSGMKKRLRRTIVSDNSDKEFMRMSVLDMDIEAWS
jgi:hypothetical protein